MRATLLLALLVPASALASPVVLRFRALERPLVLESRFRRLRAGLVEDTRLPPDVDEAQEQLVRIQREDPEGGLQVRVKSMSRRVKIDGEEVTESYEALTAGDPGKVDVFRIDALGRVRKELQGTPPADWLTLPPFPVSPGETWRGSLAATKGRPFEIPLHFRLEEVERVRGGQRARIRVASSETFPLSEQCSRGAATAS